MSDNVIPLYPNPASERFGYEEEYSLIVLPRVVELLAAACEKVGGKRPLDQNDISLEDLNKLVASLVRTKYYNGASIERHDSKLLQKVSLGDHLRVRVRGAPSVLSKPVEVSVIRERDGSLVYEAQMNLF